MHPLLKELERDNDPHDVLEIAPGVVLAARAEPEFATLAPGAVSRAAEPIFQAKPGDAATAQAPSLDATFRADDVDHRHAAGSPIGKWTRAIIGLLFAMGSAGAAVAWDHYGDRTKRMIASWTPLSVATSSPPSNAAPSEQPDTPAVSPPDAQPAAATVAPAQPVAAAQPAQAVAPNAPAPDQALSLASMAQQIEQLKASVEQLKAGQEQMSHDVARASEVKASEANLRPRTSAPKLAALPPRPAAALTRKPRPTVSAAPYVPPPLLPPIAAPAVAPQPVPEARATVETDGNPVVRPPLPVR